MLKPYQTPARDEPAWWFVISAGNMLLDQNNMPPHGALELLRWPDLTDYTVVHLGRLRERNCYLVIADLDDPNFTELGQFESVRLLIQQQDEELFALAARAKQVTEFIQTHRYCGRCGSRMEVIDWELAMQCNRCQHRCYPRISPCVIVAITKQDKILLARGKRHREGLFSVLAGFIEAGETVEQGLAREVHEEAGIRIKNIEYVGSQPWPFPHSLMLGFVAEWESGELRLDPFELEQGDWFGFDELPETPQPGSIADRLIQAARAKIEQA